MYIYPLFHQDCNRSSNYGGSNNYLVSSCSSLNWMNGDKINNPGVVNLTCIHNHEQGRIQEYSWSIVVNLTCVHNHTIINFNG